MSKKVVKLTDATFDEVVNAATEPVLVDFWADWCGPCKQITPIIDELAEEREGSLIVSKVDADANPETVLRFGVRSIPTLLLIENGEVTKRVKGAMPKNKMVAELGL